MTAIRQAPAGPAAAPSPRPPAPAPSALGYWVGGVVAVVGVILAIVVAIIGFVGMTDRIEDLQRVAVPGTADVTFDSGGGYTVYFEAAGITSGRRIPEVGAVLTPASGGDGVRFSDYGSEFEYGVPGHEGRALWTFHVDEPGTYRLTATGDPEEGATLAVGRSVAGKLAVTMAMAVVVGLCAVGAGAGVAVATAVRRRRSRAAGMAPSDTRRPPVDTGSGAS